MNIGEPLASLIGNHRQRTAFSEPCRLVEQKLWHRLFDHIYISLVKPVYHLKCIMLVFPSLVCIDTNNCIGYGTDCIDHHFVGLFVPSQFYFYYFIWRGFASFFLYNFFGIKANGKRGIWSYCGIKAPYFPPGLAHNLAHKVMKSYVYRSLCRCIVGCNGVYICKYVLNFKRRTESGKIYLF
ncbi:MAG: hypothetical protein ACD_77C00237G0003 [uncultured bacterium]|nr:MAG: hypothetical protein ACD_77C00237G0003 [uncultured bacterium]